ncbi:hypothetical protein HMPREF0454_01770 [Hafnia alvei ATCC 51873]|uniref:Uncharacterized protein n=1 Tax=Hafnia alvei ATCC 51873 TaxID=1002364 RepID=G9Y5C8_HAFAL|nr:hypothetical protein HMPREF0454_01770 [Hafnia alvei ATCC 51873]
MCRLINRDSHQANNDKVYHSWSTVVFIFSSVICSPLLANVGCNLKVLAKK